MSDTCTQLKQANEKIKELEDGGRKVIHGIVEEQGKYQVMFDGIEIMFSNDIGCRGYWTRDLSRAVNALIDRGRECGVIEDGPDYYDRNRLPHPQKPVVWVRGINDDYSSYHVPCTATGTRYSKRNADSILLEDWQKIPGIEVRIWGKPEKCSECGKPIDTD